MVHPLPKGEGRGEGKETTAPRSTYILDLTCGRCPQGYIPTHRLIGIHDFKPPAMREVSDSVLKAVTAGRKRASPSFRRTPRFDLSGGPGIRG